MTNSSLVSLKKQVAKAKAEGAKFKAEAEDLKRMSESFPRALELLDNLCIAAEGDGSNVERAAGAAREFLDNLPADLQESFRDWHPTRGGSI